MPCPSRRGIEQEIARGNAIKAAQRADLEHKTDGELLQVIDRDGPIVRRQGNTLLGGLAVSLGIPFVGSLVCAGLEAIGVKGAQSAMNYFVPLVASLPLVIGYGVYCSTGERIERDYRVDVAHELLKERGKPYTAPPSPKKPARTHDDWTPPYAGGSSSDDDLIMMAAVIAACS